MQDMKFPDFLKMLQLAATRPLTKLSLFFGSLALFLFDLAFVPKLINFIKPDIGWKVKLAIIFFPNVAYFVIWAVVRWLRSYSYSQCSVGIAIQHNTDNSKIYEEAIKRSIRTFKQLEIRKNKLKIFWTTRDLLFWYGDISITTQEGQVL